MDDDFAIEQADPDVAILVVSCDAYQDLWQPFFHCFFKYWPDCPYPVFLGSNFLSYPSPRVTPILVGPDVDYSSNLLAMLERIEQNWIILWIEDRILSAPVDTARLTNLIRLAQSRRVGYLKLTGIHPFAFVEDKTEEIGEIPKGTRYRVSITIALWNKYVLLKLFRTGETAWQIERKASRRSDAFDATFCSLSYRFRNDPPLSDVHLLIKGHLLRNSRKFLRQEGLEDFLKKRPLQTLSSYWYVKAYTVAWDLTICFTWWVSRFRQSFHRYF